MKKNLFKLLLFVLAVSMIFPLCISLTGCDEFVEFEDSDKEDDNDKKPSDDADKNNGGLSWNDIFNKGDSDGTVDSNEEENNNNNNNNNNSSSDISFGNKDYVVICSDNGAEFWRESAEGDQLDYTLYMRNRTIEKNYKVNIVPKSMKYYDIPSWVSDIIKAGDQKSVDVVNNIIAYSATIPLAGNATDLRTIPHIDLNNDWWLDTTRNDLTLNGKTHLAIGDMHTEAIGMAHVMFYNKDLLKTYNILEPGQNMHDIVVEEKTWSYLTMTNLIENARYDLNSDSRYTDQDLYGLVSDKFSYANSYLYSWDNPIFTKSEASGDLEFSLMNDQQKLSKILVNLRKMYAKTNGVYYAGYDKSIEMFVNNQAIFVNASLNSGISSLRNMNSNDWGVVPYPKYNNKQESYITDLAGNLNAICVPKTTSAEKLEKIGFITEELNRLSSTQEYDLVGEYLTKALKSENLNDPDQAEIIDIIMDGRKIDFGYVYLQFESPIFWIQDMVNNGATDISIKYHNHRSSLESAITNAYAAFGLTFPGLPQ